VPVGEGAASASGNLLAVALTRLADATRRSRCDQA
jgi:hypothetical protein